MDDKNSKLDRSQVSAELDGARFLCWYRVRSSGTVELFAAGHRMSLPMEEIPLLPESIARPLLAAIHGHSVRPDKIDESRLGVPADPAPGAAHPSASSNLRDSA